MMKVKKRNAEESECEIGDGKILYKEKSDQTQRRKGKRHTVVFLMRLGFPPCDVCRLTASQSRCLSVTMIIRVKVCVGVLSMMRATEEVLSPAREVCIP